MHATIIKLKDHFDRALSKRVDLETYSGNEWWQISPAQAEVFGLDLEDVPPLVEAWQLYEAIADVLYNDFHASALCAEAREALPFIERLACDPTQWQRFAALLGIRGEKAFAWFYKFHFGQEGTWVIRRDDDDLPMPRAALLPKPTHPPVYDMRPGLDDGIPF